MCWLECSFTHDFEAAQVHYFEAAQVHLQSVQSVHFCEYCNAYKLLLKTIYGVQTLPWICKFANLMAKK